ncbi:hypothetical protein HMPREF0367_00604 [[Eubacterium] cylindroides ATCC 27803]|uniref:Uncharacterized protein n=1 Tax=Faecalitalea cylindroides ATCC 27803 TaxID=649755 RepID=U2P7G9_9FIRM|nr:hypothetical protein HMPREF0367_00604 [[Eubacterium] cylindroides ATCC 27803] [Faecalitalea cylindroides ATCC 27803]
MENIVWIYMKRIIITRYFCFLYLKTGILSKKVRKTGILGGKTGILTRKSENILHIQQTNILNRYKKLDLLFIDECILIQTSDITQQYIPEIVERRYRKKERYAVLSLQQIPCISDWAKSTG